MVKWTTHKLEQLMMREDRKGGHWHCVLCGWNWTKKPSSGCPGLPRYSEDNYPEKLLAEHELKFYQLKLATEQSPKGCYYLNRRWYWLYDKNEALPYSQPEQKQLAQLRSRRGKKYRTCPNCKQVQDYWLDLGEYCQSCEDLAHQNLLNEYRQAAAYWAKRVLNEQGWVVIDLETTGLDTDARIVQLAIVAANGTVLLDTLINPGVAIPAEVTQIHGINDRMIQNAPAFAGVYPRLKNLLSSSDRVLIYNAEFDYTLLKSECERAGLEPVQFKPFDIMQPYAEWYGDYNAYHKDFRWQPLGGNHNAVNDCYQILQVLQQMAASYREV